MCHQYPDSYSWIWAELPLLFILTDPSVPIVLIFSCTTPAYTLVPGSSIVTIPGYKWQTVTQNNLSMKKVIYWKNKLLVPHKIDRKAGKLLFQKEWNELKHNQNTSTATTDVTSIEYSPLSLKAPGSLILNPSAIGCSTALQLSL